MTAPYGVTQFEIDENDIQSYNVLFCDITHGTPPWKPLYLLHSWLWPGYRSIERAYEYLSVPTSKGWDVRVKDGYPYVAVIMTTDEEAKEREPLFRQKIAPFIEDFGGLWEARKNELMQEYQDLKEKYSLTDYESITSLSNIQLLELLDEFIDVVNKDQWDVHMDFFVPVYYLFGLFEQLCHELLGMDATSPLFSKLMAGFESKAFEFNTKVWRLGKRAIELGLEDLFKTVDDPDELLAKLREREAGQTWFVEYGEFLDEFGWRCQRMADWSTPSWIEKPSLGMQAMKMAVASGGISSLVVRRELAVNERKEAEKEVLGKLSPEHRDWFQALMKGAQNAGFWSEDHTYYNELYVNALGRWITREVGRRFADAGVVDDPEDVYFLIHSDFHKALVPMGKVKLQKTVATRKQEWQHNMEAQPELFLGDPSFMGVIARKDPVISAAATMPNVREELKADLYGASSAPGYVEGVARVIVSEHELGQLQPGEILIAPATAAPWMPAFEIISGLVTDGGGALSHAVIVAREYGIPAVTGCGDATKKIKTGDRIRVDGDLGVVYIIGDLK
jgi:phosphohistidine swiveling domain-containing protein